MKQPTKAQRHAIYMKALAQIKKKDEAWTCNEIAIAYEKIMYGGKKTDFTTAEILSLFPEHNAQKPAIQVGDGSVWFNRLDLGTEKVKELRIILMVNCLAALQISQTEELFKRLGVPNK